MAPDPVSYSEKIDITNCEKEPIHIIGEVQSHGVLIACDAESLEIKMASANTGEKFSLSFTDLEGKSISCLIGRDREEDIKRNIAERKPLLPEEIIINGNGFLVLPHLSEGHLILDFEPYEKNDDQIDFQRHLTRILNRFRAAGGVGDLCREAAILTRDLFEYDRVMIYKFDEDWNGEVVAEDKLPEAESWLGLRYPASDIPAQARNIFFKHRVRIISNVHDVPVPLVPQISPVTTKPLDLSRSWLRGVSPIHLEYLENMGVGASLTAAIIVDNRLWGLIACHHNQPKYINFYQRESCRFLAQMFSNELSLRETNRYLEQKEVSEEVRKDLASQMQQEENLLDALTSHGLKFTDLIPCDGGALFINNELRLTGNTPSEEEVRDLIENYLDSQPRLFSSSNLSADYPGASEYQEKASGILSLRIAENNFMIWFRPEVIQTVTWGGNPDKKVTYNEEKKRLSPRKSFEKWTQQVTGTSEPWGRSEHSAANALGNSLSYFILVRQHREIESLNAKILQANRDLELFSYGLSHDLRAPLRGITGYLQIIKEDYSGTMEESGNLLLDSTMGLAERMDQLIEDILSYSKFSSGEIEMQEFSVTELVKEVIDFLGVRTSYPNTELLVQEDLPPMKGDRRMIFQVWVNLINNAFIYSSKKEHPKVEIGSISQDDKNVYFVKDNGIGIAPEYKEKIFATFSRLAGESYKGSGIGLSLVKRVLQKHDGQVWVESEPENGSVFYFFV